MVHTQTDVTIHEGLMGRPTALTLDFHMTLLLSHLSNAAYPTFLIFKEGDQLS